MEAIFCLHAAVNDVIWSRDLQLNVSASYFFALLLLVVNEKGFQLSGVHLASCSFPSSSSCVN